jgi:fused signal recognition particle receptor
MGVDTARARHRQPRRRAGLGRRLSVAEMKGALAEEIARIMEPGRPPPADAIRRDPRSFWSSASTDRARPRRSASSPRQFRAAGKSVVIAAGDTFRAAAVEQLQVWGAARGCPGPDRAPKGPTRPRLAFDALTQRAGRRAPTFS